MSDRDACCTHGGGRHGWCAEEHDARDLLAEEYDALHRVYLIAQRMTLHGKTPGHDAASLLGELESAVLSAQDALPYHRKGPT